MYAQILQNPGKHGYPVLPAGSAKAPKFGHIFVENRVPGARRPKLVDGFDWVPSSTANASTRILCDGETELLRFYCARRTKDEDAKPQVKPFTLYQRSVYETVKAENLDEDSYDLKKRVGDMWRKLPENLKEPFVRQAKEHNKKSRQRMSRADPAQLLVRHEMRLRKNGIESNDTVLVHYLGDDAFQLLYHPPRPMRVVCSSEPGPSAAASAASLSIPEEEQLEMRKAANGADAASEAEAYTIRNGVQTSSLRFFIGHAVSASATTARSADGRMDGTLVQTNSDAELDDDDEFPEDEENDSGLKLKLSKAQYSYSSL